MNNKKDGWETVLEQGLMELRISDPVIDEALRNRFDTVLALLWRYIAEIELFNPAYGLVGVKDTRELVVKHILDSLAPLGLIRRLLDEQGGGASASLETMQNIADVGSGAGLPGIPLAIAVPDCHFTLIECMGRRAGFLRNTQAVLGLPNVEIEQTGMEQAAAGRFRLITFRAFRLLEPAALKDLFRLLAPGGVLAAYKGHAAKIADELAALDPAAWKAVPISVPFLDAERHIVVIRPVSKQD
jgi:16S rRNA (guanine527-N7)-methyltransferase